MSDSQEDSAIASAIASASPQEAPVAPTLEEPLAAAPGVLPETTLLSAVGFKLATAMFLHHFTSGVWAVTLSSYVSANSGASGSAIFTAGFVGVIYGAGPLGGMVAPFITGVLADHWFAAERLMAVLNVLCALALCAAIGATSQTAFFLSVFAFYLCYYPSFSLNNSLALHHLTRPERHFPAVRAFGTIGWIAAGVAVGWVWPWWTGEFIETAATPMKLGVVSAAITALFCFWLPHTPPVRRRASTHQRVSVSADLWELLRHRDFAALLVVALLAHMPSQFYYAYGNAFFNWTGMTAAAAKMTLGQVVEVGCMLLLPAILLRMDAKTAILLGLAAWSCRFWMLMVGASPAAPARWAVLFGAIMFHGLAFTLVTISLQMEVDRHAGRHRRATAQGLFSIAMQGFGCFAGAEMAGLAGAYWLPSDVAQATVAGWQSFWRLPAIMAAAVMAIAALLLRQRPD